MSGITVSDYEPLHDLHKGIALVEASAGTGKTHNITNLYGEVIEPVRRLNYRRKCPCQSVL